MILILQLLQLITNNISIIELLKIEFYIQQFLNTRCIPNLKYIPFHGKCTLSKKKNQLRFQQDPLNNFSRTIPRR